MSTFGVYNVGSVLACQTLNIFIPLDYSVACFRIVKLNERPLVCSEERVIVLEVTVPQKDTGFLRKFHKKVQYTQVNRQCEEQEEDANESGKVHFGHKCE